MLIRSATQNDLHSLARLALRLWEEHTEEDLFAEFSDIFATGQAQFFLAFENAYRVEHQVQQIKNDYLV